MARERLFVCFTLNAESVERDSSFAGPPTWSACESRLRGYVDALAEVGMRGTIFATSDIAKRLGPKLEDLERAGFEIGFLCHPRIEGFKGKLASYKIDQQKEIVSTGVARFADGFGREPQTFRSGDFSANDDTLIVLCECGFRQCSTSLPERRVLPLYSDWEDAYPFAHHVDPLDRKKPGTLELYEVPVTSDFDKTTLNGQQDFTPIFLGSEERDIDKHAPMLVEKHLKRMADEQVYVRTIVAVSSNVADYANAQSRPSRMLRVIVDTVREFAEKYDLELVPATIADVHDEADKLYREGKMT